MIKQELLLELETEKLTDEEITLLINKLCALKVNRPSTLKDKVELVLKSRNKLAQVNREEIAACLNMSTRTLSRKLKMENTGFYELLETERRRRCRHYLENNITCASKYAELLGFSDISHFYRSFKTWTGYKFFQAKVLLAENNRNIDIIFHRQNEKED